MSRRDHVIEFEIRVLNGACRLKPLGRDRFCNRYWYFDVVHGSVPKEAITKLDFDPSALRVKEVKPDPDIPFDYSTGLLFVEQMPNRDRLEDEFSPLRLGLVEGSWGYYSTCEEVISFHTLKKVGPPQKMAGSKRISGINSFP